MEALGADEIMTYSFCSPKVYDKLLLAKDDPRRRSVVIRNPLGEDTSLMRTIALPGMLDVLAHNYNNRNERACLYELGNIYLPHESDEELPDERCILTCGLYGGGCDFFTAKGILEGLFARIHLAPWEAEACEDRPYYHPGRCARITCGEDVLGYLYEVHPKASENFGLGHEAVYGFELDMALLQAHAQLELDYQTLPRFPSVSRDLALLCKEDLPVAVLEKAIRKGRGETPRTHRAVRRLPGRTDLERHEERGIPADPSQQDRHADRRGNPRRDGPRDAGTGGRRRLAARLKPDKSLTFLSHLRNTPCISLGLGV